MSLPVNVDPEDLSQTGWGIVFARGEDPEVEEQLRGLIERRESQAGKRFKRIDYWPGDSGRTFLWHRHGEAPGVIDPDVLPYYLLLVGSPEAIPFDVQSELGVSHAVGRLYFSDPEDYGRYAENVVAAECSQASMSRRLLVFAPTQGESRAMQMLTAHLVDPLEEQLTSRLAPPWMCEVWRGKRARRTDLSRLVSENPIPSLLFIAAQSRRLAPGHPSQEDLQGSILCEGGPEASEKPSEDAFFSAEDLPETANLSGMIAVLFSGFSMGTPIEDSFPYLNSDWTLNKRSPPRVLCARPFVAKLPQKLLRQGALGLAGYVDRNWTLSFAWSVPGAQTVGASGALFEFLEGITCGKRLGSAFRPLSRRSATLGTQVAEMLERERLGRGVAQDLLTTLMIAHRDASNFILLGDPATRLDLIGGELEGGKGEVSTKLMAMLNGLSTESGVAVEQLLKEATIRLSLLTQDPMTTQATELAVHANADRLVSEEAEIGADLPGSGTPGELAARVTTGEALAEATGAEEGLGFAEVESARPPLVFLSYAREDQQKVRRLYKGLRDRGVDVWMDTENVRWGDPFRIIIQGALKECDFAIVCLSSRAVKKRGFIQTEFGWIQSEAGERPREEPFILPLKLDRCDVPRGYGFEDLTWREIGREVGKFLDHLASEIFMQFRVVERPRTGHR